MQAPPPRRFRSALPLVGAIALGGGFAFLFVLNVSAPPRSSPAPGAHSVEAPRPPGKNPAPVDNPTIVSSVPPQPPAEPGDPALAEITALARAGRYAEAVQRALESPAEQSLPLLTLIFSLWTKEHPPEAAMAALGLSGDQPRRAAWMAVLSAWSRSEPTALADYAARLAPGADRGEAITASVREWLGRDPATAASWVARALPDSDFDGAVAAIALSPRLATDRPDTAIRWAEAIANPGLRSRTAGAVVRDWLSVDRAAAASYARNSPVLTPSEREDILVGERFTPHP